MGATWAPQMSVGARENKPIDRDFKVREISHEIWQCGCSWNKRRERN